ncbi:MAG: glycine cleavage system protein R [Myxococcales bacterium]|nr:glycine cleavage system protein R [Myxococcales bacterium]
MPDAERSSSLIVTLIGMDRPGLVALVARVVADHQGNWVESRMAHLAGRFAGILRVDVPPGKVDALAAALTHATAGALTITLDRADGPAAALPTAPDAHGLTELELVGADHPGIVHAITAILLKHGANIWEFESECVAAPMTGAPLFKAKAQIALPESGRLAALGDDLEAIASDLMVELRISNR